MPFSSTKVVQNTVGATTVRLASGETILTAIRALNTTGAVAYVQLFDKAATTDVTLGTTIPDWVVRSEANDPSLGDGLPTSGLTFRLGIVVASTTTLLGLTGATQHVRIAVQ